MSNVYIDQILKCIELAVFYKSRQSRLTHLHRQSSTDLWSLCFTAHSPLPTEAAAAGAAELHVKQLLTH